MKKIALFLMMCMTAAAFAEPLASVDAKTKCISVKTEHYSCVFFPKHAFPVEFRTVDGEEFPRVVHFLDRVVAPRGKGKQAFYLWRDQWAEQTVKVNNDNDFVLECKGVYCDETSAIECPGKMRATYTYTIHRKSPVIKVVAVIERDDNTPVTVVFLQPAWNGKIKEFDHAYTGKTRVPFDDRLTNRVWRDLEGAALAQGRKFISINYNNHDKCVSLRYRTGDAYTSILTWYRQKVTSKRLLLTGYITVKTLPGK